MRLTRRSMLLGSGAMAALGVAGIGARHALARPMAVAEPTALTLSATPVAHLSVTEPERARFGALAFRSGLVLRAETSAFGGLSGLWRSTDGARLVAVTDNAQWLTARVKTREGRLAALSDAMLAPILGPHGTPLRAGPHYDTEGLAFDGRTAYLSIERRHALMRFAWRPDLRAPGAFIPLPPEMRRLPSNGGIEAIGVAPRSSPLAGALVAIAERLSGEDDAPTRGVILTGPRQGVFEVARAGGFSVSDLAFLPGGDMLVLERRFSLFGGFAVRLRRVAGETIRPGARLDGPVIFASAPGMEMDNLEGLCVHEEGGEIRLTLVSDDNFNSLQRTLLLEFSLED